MDVGIIPTLIEAAPFKPQDIIAHACALGFYGSVISFFSGFVYIVFGWRMFKIMVVIICSFLGLYLGMILGELVGYPILGGALGSVLLAICSLPLMRFSTGVIIATLTALIVAYGWQLFEMPSKYMPFAAAGGLIAGALCGFFLFRLAVITYTSLLGASMIVAGFLGFLFAATTGKETTISPSDKLIIASLALITAIGILLQYQIHGKSSEKGKER